MVVFSGVGAAEVGAPLAASVVDVEGGAVSLLFLVQAVRATAPVRRPRPNNTLLLGTSGPLLANLFIEPLGLCLSSITLGAPLLWSYQNYK